MSEKLDLNLERGITFSQTLSVGSSFDGYTVESFIRDGTNAAASLLGQFTATTVSGGNTIISMTAAETLDLRYPVQSRFDQASFRFGFWDIKLTNGATTVRPFFGSVNLSQLITRQD